jgi:small GTP-binding protein
MTDFNFKIYEYKGNLYKIQIWDIAGQDRSIQTTKVLTKNAHGCIIFCDITQKKTLEETKKWKAVVDENALFIDDTPLPCILVQNKIDLVSEKDIINDSDFQKFSERNNFLNCFRTSVKLNIGVDNVMNFLLEHIINKLIEISEEKISDTHSVNSFRISQSGNESVMTDINNGIENCC